MAEILYRKLSELKTYPKNYRIGDVEAIIRSIRAFGFNSLLRIWKDNEILAGNHTFLALKSLYDLGESAPDRIVLKSGEWLIPCIDLSGLSEEEAKAYLLADNRISDLAGNDDEALVQLLREIEDPDLIEATGFSEDEYRDLLNSFESTDTGSDAETDSSTRATDQVHSEEASQNAEAESQDNPKRLKRSDVPDAIFPGDNEWGIPTLDLSLQAEVVYAPVVKWGTIPRTAIMTGSYHAYADDYKMQNWWKDPSQIVNSRCKAAVEPNWSSNVQMPRALVLYDIFRKRYIARVWQTFGVRVFVDLNVEREFADLILLGVPQGWTAYANRAYHDDTEHILWGYELARQRAGKEPLYLVIGGRVKVRDLCASKGFIWVAEDIARNRQEEIVRESFGSEKGKVN